MQTMLANQGNRPDRGASSEVLDIRKKFFMMKMVTHWNRLPREAADATSLEVFKARWDGALSNLI